VLLSKTNYEIMKTAVIYFSHTGNNRLIANEIAGKIQADSFPVTEPRRRSTGTIFLDMFFRRSAKIDALPLDWTRYDHILLVAPVWGGLIASPMKAFIKAEHANFPQFSFASLCIGLEGQEEKIRKQLVKWTGEEPKAVMQFETTRLVSPEKEVKDINLTFYRVKPQEMDKFEEKITALIIQIRQAISGEKYVVA